MLAVPIGTLIAHKICVLILASSRRQSITSAQFQESEVRLSTGCHTNVDCRSLCNLADPSFQELQPEKSRASNVCHLRTL